MADPQTRIPFFSTQITLPIPELVAHTLGLALLFIGFAVTVHLLQTLLVKKIASQPASLRFLNLFAIVLAPIWLFLFAHVILSLWRLTAEFDPAIQDNDLRWHVLAFIGLITALGGLTSAPLALVRVWTTERQTRTAEQGHMTDRISKAVEQLGAEKTVKTLNDDGATVETSEPNIEVRIGGLLSLERIAQDSTAYDKGRDHVRVMEILCAYVRENAKATDLEPTHQLSELKQPRTDIQTAINVLKDRSPEQVGYEATRKYRLDLRNCNLDGCDFSKGKLAGALMSASRFEGATFNHADLTGTIFLRSLFHLTVFWNATLHGTILDRCENSDTFQYQDAFIGANFHGVSIEGANMPSLYITEREADNFFGSSDTTLAESQRQDKEQGLELSKNLARTRREGATEGDLRALVEAASSGARLFAHWNPYTATDLAAQGYRGPYRDRKKLHGWPFDDL